MLKSNLNTIREFNVIEPANPMGIHPHPTVLDTSQSALMNAPSNTHVCSRHTTHGYISPLSRKPKNTGNLGASFPPSL